MKGRLDITGGHRLPALLAGLVLVLMASAVAAVYAKHQTRKQFVELQGLVAERDRLEMDWGRLQLERSTLGSHARVEQLARERLDMRTPEPAEIQMVAQ